ncbi:hypothetical protein EJB05_23403, partial [Eragrostis curvula]
HRTAVSDFREMTQTSGGHGDHGTAGVRFIAPKRLKNGTFKVLLKKLSAWKAFLLLVPGAEPVLEQ